MPPIINNVSLVTVYVTDRTAAKNWYIDILGFVETADIQMGDNGFRWVTVAHPDHRERYRTGTCRSGAAHCRAAPEGHQTSARSSNHLTMNLRSLSATRRCNCSASGSMAPPTSGTFTFTEPEITISEPSAVGRSS